MNRPPQYLWRSSGIGLFVTVDKSLSEADGGVPLQRAIPQLDELLARTRRLEVVSTRMRSVIRDADEQGVARNVAQQFEVGHRILNGGLVPILDLEADISRPIKAGAERRLLTRIEHHGVEPPGDVQSMLKLSIPTVDGLTFG